MAFSYFKGYLVLDCAEEVVVGVVFFTIFSSSCLVPFTVPGLVILFSDNVVYFFNPIFDPPPIVELPDFSGYSLEVVVFRLLAPAVEVIAPVLTSEVRYANFSFISSFFFYNFSFLGSFGSANLEAVFTEVEGGLSFVGPLSPLPILETGCAFAASSYVSGLL